MTNDDIIDIAAGLPIDPAAEFTRRPSVAAAVPRGRSVELDSGLAGISADDIAAELATTAGYRELDADAAAYLWLARTQGVSQRIGRGLIVPGQGGAAGGRGPTGPLRSSRPAAPPTTALVSESSCQLMSVESRALALPVHSSRPLPTSLRLALAT